MIRTIDESLSKKDYHGINLNYQLFAAGGGDKTEKATPKKKNDARKKGQIFQSREMSASIILIIMIVSIKALGSNLYGQLTVYMKNTFTEYVKVKDAFDINLVLKLYIDAILVLAKTVLPLLLIAALAAVIVGYAQVGVLFTFETLKIKGNRINPLSGFKRIFSMRSLVELLKSIIKIVIVAWVAYSYLKSKTNEVLALMDADLPSILSFIGDATFNVAIKISFALVILGFADYMYQRFDYEKNLRMTKQEVKDEYKQTEGNPEIKGKIKQKQRQMSMRRMMQDVPKADVVITNPTHFAVAIKYDLQKASAPYIVAKGQDYIALRIKQIAAENKVQVVENKPLARTLFSTVDIGEAIPPELYQAVAEILAFVYKIKNGG
ncbi:flagellar biosynthetic protein FlhB [Ruminiclostridium sufflavum DSM 19573]|uniref:Flagellar biosynthetic protein FlhB n=1 Tax=Ruminiclostridium sufflavum DSM 19573 TaxID=1121337 RepID=A0A318XQZ8_9FIRM|nr:flagellar biosynthesis protein FlhB [Ruminiclostridium sufflavum]PYG89836.1 flagellar biosynthetic protein FlhB [Ruminiclostridium sufflavum DSM 19573]